MRRFHLLPWLTVLCFLHLHITYLWPVQTKLASFDLHTRVWRRITPKAPSMDAPGRRSINTAVTAVAVAPGPRAFHVAWAFNGNVYIHGGEGLATGDTGLAGDLDLDDVLGSAGRDPFAEEDGGAPLEAGRILTAASGRNVAVSPGLKARYLTNAEEMAAGGKKAGKVGETPLLLRPAEGRPAMSVLEDLWKFDCHALRWERVREEHCIRSTSFHIFRSTLRNTTTRSVIL